MKKLQAIIIAITAGIGIAAIATAARNSSGTYSLVAGNPVTSGTTISSTWANNTLSDLSTEITDSLSRSGKGAMLAPLKLTDGTNSAPSLTFANDTDSGLYRIGANNVGLSAGGTKMLDCTSTGCSTPGTLAVTGASTLTGNTAVTGTLTVGGGGAISKIIKGSGSVDIPNVTGQGCNSNTLAVTGAAVGDVCTLANVGSFSLAYRCYVADVDLVAIVACNGTASGINPAAETMTVWLIR